MHLITDLKFISSFNNNVSLNLNILSLSHAEISKSENMKKRCRPLSPLLCGDRVDPVFIVAGDCAPCASVWKD